MVAGLRTGLWVVALLSGCAGAPATTQRDARQDPELRQLRQVVPDVVARAEAVARARQKEDTPALAQREAGLWQLARVEAERVQLAADLQAQRRQGVLSELSGRQRAQQALREQRGQEQSQAEQAARARFQAAYQHLVDCTLQSSACREGQAQTARVVLLRWVRIYKAFARALRAGDVDAERGAVGGLEWDGTPAGWRGVEEALVATEAELGKALAQRGDLPLGAVRSALVEAGTLRGLPLEVLEDGVVFMPIEPTALGSRAVGRWAYGVRALGRLYPAWTPTVVGGVEFTEDGLRALEAWGCAVGQDDATGSGPVGIRWSPPQPPSEGSGQQGLNAAPGRDTAGTSAALR